MKTINTKIKIKRDINNCLNKSLNKKWNTQKNMTPHFKQIMEIMKIQKHKNIEKQNIYFPLSKFISEKIIKTQKKIKQKQHQNNFVTNL